MHRDNLFPDFTLWRETMAIDHKLLPYDIAEQLRLVAHAAHSTAWSAHRQAEPGRSPKVQLCWRSDMELFAVAVHHVAGGCSPCECGT
jgi:hypothetical protein